MTYRPAPVPPDAPVAIAARLEPDAIGVAQDTVIGMASSAPAGTMAATLAALAVASAYGSGPVLILTALPMLIIANSYRRLNLWSATCGASFEWVGRAINPYLGFITGWLMIAGYVIGTVAEVVVLGPSVLAVFGSRSADAWASIGIDTALCLIMLAVAVAGIRITARTQIAMAAAEYLILVVFSVAGLVAVLGHRAGTFPVARGWFSLSGIGGRVNLAAGLLISVYVYRLWDGTVHVNEEVKHRRENPGKAAVYAVALLTVLYTLAQVGLQGVVSPARLQANASTAMVYVATALGGAGWARLMALAIALSVIAATGTGIVLTSRIVYGMARLPDIAAAARPGISPVQDPGRRKRGGRRAHHRRDLGLYRGDVRAGHLRRGGKPGGPAGRGVLHPDRAGHHRLLPAADLRQCVGRDAGRHSPASRRRVPRLDHRQVGARRAGVTAVVAGRGRGGRRHRHGLRPVRPAVRALPDPARNRLQGAVMNAPARPVRTGQHVVTCLLCEMTDPSPDSPCLPGWDHRVSPPEAGCPGCRLKAICARRFPCEARRSRFRWRLVRLRLRRAWRRLRPRPGPSCRGTPGRCSRL